MRILAFASALMFIPPQFVSGQSGATGPALDGRVQQVEIFASAVIDANGDLRIETSDRRTIVLPREGEQRSFGEPILSANQGAVGAQAYYANCCTSYDIPLQLVVYSNSRVHRFTGNGLPIFQWRFADGGTRVAFGQEPVHFSCEIHYELRDVRSERLLDSVDVPQPCGLQPDPPKTQVPKWVEDLNAARK